MLKPFLKLLLSLLFPKVIDFSIIFDLKDSLNLKDERISENFKTGDVIDTIVERYSMPTRFGKRYKKVISELSNLSVLYGYEARDFSLPNEVGVVESIKVKNI